MAVMLATALAVVLAGCGRDQRPAPSTASSPPVTVRAVSLQLQSYQATEDVAGTVRARLRAAIEAKIPARIERMLVAPGHVVKAGDLLAELDARELQSRLEQAVPVMRNAETEMKRFKALVEQRAVSQSEFDAIEARYRVAVAAVTEAETTLGHTRILAPFGGVITRKLADVGDLAYPGRSLVEIEDPKALRVEADVPESLIHRIQLGARLTVTAASGRDISQGVVSEIAPAADSATRTFLVKLDLPGDTPLRAGQFARVAVPRDESLLLRVPTAAVVQRGQVELVFVVQEGRAQMRLVKTGRRLGSDWEIVSGLAPDDRVIVEHAERLRDQQPVEVKP